MDGSNGASESQALNIQALVARAREEARTSPRRATEIGFELAAGTYVPRAEISADSEAAAERDDEEIGDESEAATEHDECAEEEADDEDEGAEEEVDDDESEAAIPRDKDATMRELIKIEVDALERFAASHRIDETIEACANLVAELAWYVTDVDARFEIYGLCRVVGADFAQELGWEGSLTAVLRAHNALCCVEKHRGTTSNGVLVDALLAAANGDLTLFMSHIYQAASDLGRKRPPEGDWWSQPGEAWNERRGALRALELG
jgi:hypothetical protein